MAINFPEKTKTEMVKRFDVESETGDLFSHELDMEFSGVNTVHVHVVNTVPMQDYNSGKQVGTGSRYGNTEEVGDHKISYTMRKKRSLSLSIDKTNNKDQFNMKSAKNVMKAEKEEHIIPELDKYRFAEWAANGGIHMKVPTLTKANIAEQVVDLHTLVKNAHVGKSVKLVIKRSASKFLKLSDEFTKLDSIGGKVLRSGEIGDFDGMRVKEVTDDLLPANVPFIILYKGSVISPMKIEQLRVHVDPPGLAGDLIEYLMYYDAFVLGNLADGVAVAVLGDAVCATPTVTMNGDTATFACATSGVTYKYTLDGSDPRFSNSAKTGGSAAVAAGDQLRVAAVNDDLYWSNLYKSK